MKKVISLILSILLVISYTCSVTLFANAMENSSSFSVGTAQSRAGGTVEIPIEIQNNLGITSFRIMVEYESAILKLTNVVFREAAQGFNTGTSQLYDSPYSISGFNAGVDINNNNGQLAVLTFEINQYAEEGRYDISLTYDEDDIFNMAGDIVPFAVNNGYVEVIPCQHTGGEWEYLEKETCTKDGIMIKKCELCGNEYESKKVNAKGHIFCEWVIDKAATCTENGEKSRVCSVCTYEESEIIDALGHNYGNGTVVTAPTCTKTGIKTYTCTECGETKTETIPKTAHMYKTTVTKATTKKNGSIVTKCSVCGNVSKNTVIYYPKTITLSTTSYTYNGKVKKPSVTVKDSKGKKISSSNYTVSYSSGRKNVGQYTVTIKFKGNYSGTVKKTFTIKPKATSLSKVTAGKKAFTVKWKKQTSQTTGYQIQYSTSSKFKGAKTVTISKNKTTSKKISKLKAKKKYYVRIRTYKTVKVNGKNTKVYSGWSKVKTVKTK